MTLSGGLSLVGDLLELTETDSSPTGANREVRLAALLGTSVGGGDRDAAS